MRRTYIRRFVCSGLLALSMIAGLAIAAEPSTRPSELLEVRPIDEASRSRLHLDPFYTQLCEADGFPIAASARANPLALKEAAFLINHELEHRPDVRRAMIDSGVHCTVMAVSEMTTDVPEHSALTPKDYWDRRARGLGATPEAPCVSCGEENLLGLTGDPYSTENILIHEFGHAIHETGLNKVDPTFDDRLKQAYEQAKAQGLWSKTYALTDRNEYWAEGTQSWFDCNRANDNAHNDIDTREKLKVYDPRLAALLAEVYGDGAWRYVKPSERADAGHLIGLNVSQLPAFRWPARLAATTKSTAPTSQR